MGTIVARGAVLRGLNKEFGPDRLLRRSYGISRLHEYQPELPSHALLNPRFVEYRQDNKHWVLSLDWIFQKVCLKLRN